MDPVTPPGWLRLARGTVITEGDRWWDRERQEWAPTRTPGGKVGGALLPKLYIRQVKPLEGQGPKE